MSTEQERHQFTGALQTALSKSDVVNVCVSSAATVVRADALGFYELDPVHGRVVDVHANASKSVLDEYECYGRQDDPVLEFVIQHRRPTDSSRLKTSKSWSGSGAQDALATGGFAHSLEAPLVVSGVLFGTMNFARTSAHPKFDKTDLISARIISEQIGLATERALRYEMMGSRAGVLENALDRLPEAILVTDLDAQPVFANRRARTDWPSALQRDADDEESVSGCVDHAMSVFRSGNKRVVTRTIRDSRTKRRAVVKSYRLSELDRTAVTTIHATDLNAGISRLPDWGVLTKREQEIARLVSEGHTTREIASRAFISENTVKQHLKRVFSKADVSNRAELIQLIWSSGDAT